MLITARRRWVFLLTLLVLLLWVPFLNKPVHIDDPVVLKVAENVLADPLDPMGGELDWFGRSLPTWQVTTNPPLLSYCLAPWLALFGPSEVVLHLALTPFLLLLAFSAFDLSKRFTRTLCWLPFLFVMFSPAVWVSVNLMRDVPAAALATASVALLVSGTDRGSRKRLIAAAVFAGLATLTKYSAMAMWPLLLIYPVLKRRYRLSGWAILTLLFPLAWCGLTGLQYGEAHPLYLLSGRHPTSTFGFHDKLFAGLTVLGSCLFLTPALLAALVKRRERSAWLATLAVGLAAPLGALSYHGAGIGFEYLFWTVLGAIPLFLGIREGVVSGKEIFGREGNGQASDSLFLVAWFLGPFSFSLLFVPFQAVRHIIPALLPLALLSFRYLDTARALKGWGYLRALTVVLLVVQLAAGTLVHIADYEYAATYRDFAAEARTRWTSDRYQTWFVGHWGWMFYAQRAGFRQLGADPPYPQEGDILLWPRQVHIGEVFQENGALIDRLEELEERVYRGKVPILTMHPSGAGFYAVVRNKLPYRFADLPLETMRVYRVGPE